MDRKTDRKNQGTISQETILRVIGRSPNGRTALIEVVLPLRSDDPVFLSLVEKDRDLFRKMTDDESDILGMIGNAREDNNDFLGEDVSLMYGDGNPYGICAEEEIPMGFYE